MYPGTGLVHNINGFVRKKAVGDIAFGKLYGFFDSIFGIVHMVMRLIFRLDIVENLYGLINRSGLDHNFLEPPVESSVFFNKLTIFVERGCSDTLQLAPG